MNNNVTNFQVGDLVYYLTSKSTPEIKACLILGIESCFMQNICPEDELQMQSRIRNIQYNVLPAQYEKFKGAEGDYYRYEMGDDEDIFSLKEERLFKTKEEAKNALLEYANSLSIEN